ncbi:hypothetical protein BD311DRAFT_468297 [Dichomitus squalens]|uniref:Uncharacterized protein n=1 Tax=Dichomitus squalens TaxID=114155 RepID=A0A4Q9MEY9_9APHY|nr:hypothetical protein BD311DRAFT_468297 [Dichomitus squalens]
MSAALRSRELVQMPCGDTHYGIVHSLCIFRVANYSNRGTRSTYTIPRKSDIDPQTLLKCYLHAYCANDSKARVCGSCGSGCIAAGRARPQQRPRLTRTHREPRSRPFSVMWARKFEEGISGVLPPQRLSSDARSSRAGLGRWKWGRGQRALPRFSRARSAVQRWGVRSVEIGTHYRGNPS